MTNVFIKNTQTGVTTLASVASDGTQGDGSSGDPTISSDGRYVVFDSFADNLASGAGGNTQAVFIHDTQTGSTTLVSASSNGTPANENSDYPSVSEDGNTVVFRSYATNLVTGVPSGNLEIYEKNMTTGAVTLLSQNGSGTPANYNSNPASISCDGSVVVFESNAPNLPGANGNQDDIYEDVLSNGAHTLTNLTASANSDSDYPAISCDGSSIVYASDATNLVSGVTNGTGNIYEYSRLSGTNTLVSVTSNGTELSSRSYAEWPAVSGDGRFVTFHTTGSSGYLDNHLVTSQGAIYIHDMDMGTTQAVAVDPTDNYAVGGGMPAISADGTSIVFTPADSNLVPGANFNNIFLAQFAPVAPANLTIPSPTAAPVLSWNGVYGATSYNVYANGTLIGSTTATTYTDNSPTPGSDTYYVTAVSTAGESSPSNNAYVTVESLPVITSASSYSTGMRQPITPANFTVTTTGTPTAAITESGTLPSGITFTDNGNGTANFSGMANAGTNGTYPITITATNSAGSYTQHFTLTITTATSAPTFTSSNTDTEVYGVPFSFTVTTTGYPVETSIHKIEGDGSLPPGVTLTYNGDGTATLSGTPDNTAAGTYTFTLTAINGVGSPVDQVFTMTITKTPVFKTIRAGQNPANVGSPYSLVVTATGYGTPTMTESGSLPGGLSFQDNGNGTATISGTPAVGSGGSYSITVTATNSYGSTSDTFTLKNDEAPTITSSNSAAATIGTAFYFPVTSTGFPSPTYTLTGVLPQGLHFYPGPGTFGGTPAVGTAGSYPVTITVTNSSGTATQSFTLVVS